MKYFAVLAEDNVPDGETGIAATFQISTDSETEANQKLDFVITWYPDKTFKKFIHYCGNSANGDNISCYMKEIK